MQRFTFKRLVFLGFLATMLCVFLQGVFSYLNIAELRRREKLANQTERILALTNKIHRYLITAESNERGYIITGDQDFLERYIYAKDMLIPALSNLSEMFEGSPKQVKNVDSLTFYISQKLQVMDLKTTIYDQNKREGRQNILLSKSDRSYTDTITKRINKIQIIEQQILASRNMQTGQIATRILAIISVGGVVIFCLVVLLSALIRQTFNTQKKIKDELQEKNAQLKKLSKESEKQNWLLEGAVILDAAMRGAQTITERSDCIITQLSKYVGADVGAIYLMNAEKGLLEFHAGYGFSKSQGRAVINLNEGLTGLAIKERRLVRLDNINGSYMKISSAIGETVPSVILIQPIFFQDALKCLIEIAFSGQVPGDVENLLETVSYSIGVSLNAAEVRVQMQELVERTRSQAEELAIRHAELSDSNAELIRKTQLLQVSEEELIVQQEELRQTNTEIEEKAQLLEERNQAITQANESIAVKARELEQSNRYKSDFLANMSHELRTPLNSILILARILKENKLSNLSEEQIKYAGVIHNAGSDLLTLINDILDLSKIESGKVDVTYENVEMESIVLDIQAMFSEVANAKKIAFSCQMGEAVPAIINTDRLRVEQILKNLLSNAFKFTPERGKVDLSISLNREIGKDSKDANDLPNLGTLIFEVSDSGIGIAEDKQKAIFEAFQQADGSTSRKYGGTGLGLSISRKLAVLLGGGINVRSELNQGSTFSFYMPIDHTMSNLETVEVSEPAGVSPNKNQGDTYNKQKDFDLNNSPKEYKLLIVEDDPYFADILKSYSEDRGFKTLVASQGDTGLQMAKDHIPDAIILDIMLPVMDGWSVLKSLKEDKVTCKIPVHMMSAKDETNARAKEEGAIGLLRKPVEKDDLEDAFDLLIRETGSMTRVLLVEDLKVQSDDLAYQLSKKNIIVEQTFNGEQTMNILVHDARFDCIILDLKLPDISGLDLLEKIKNEKALNHIPVLINTAMELDTASMTRILRHTDVMVLKNNKSNDRILDEVNLFMNNIKAEEPVPTKPLPYQRQGLSSTDTTTLEKALKNRSVLIVDDDMRNIFALTTAFQGYDLDVQIANNGKEALSILEAFPETDIVLMDIMMPEMDGYQAMSEIRKQKRFNKLPIIALTANAMKADRQRCVEAGASDYVSKPVDIDKLLSMMRVWLS